MTRFHGCFAPNAKCRPKLIPAQPPSEPQAEDAGAVSDRAALLGELAQRLDWAALLARVFKIDVLKCDACGGRMRVLAFLTDPEVTERILDHLGLPITAPALRPARDPPNDESAESESGDCDPGPVYEGIDLVPDDFDPEN
jgi:hypothetical protein